MSKAKRRSKRTRQREPELDADTIADMALAGAARIIEAEPVTGTESKEPSKADGMSNGTPPSADWVPMAEAVILAGLSDRTLRRRIDSGQLTARREKPNRLLLSRAELEALSQHERQPRTATARHAAAMPPTMPPSELTACLATITKLSGDLVQANQRADRLLGAGDVDREAATREVSDLRAQLASALTSVSHWRVLALVLAALAVALAVLVGMDGGVR